MLIAYIIEKIRQRFTPSAQPEWRPAPSYAWNIALIEKGRRYRPWIYEK